MILELILLTFFIKKTAACRSSQGTDKRQNTLFLSLKREIDYSTTRTARTVHPIKRLLPFNFAKSEAK